MGMRKTKLYIAIGVLLILALLVSAQQAFNLTPLIGSPSTPDEIVLLYTLSTLTVLALLIFGFLLLRTLIKVWIERKQQKPGSKFKTSVIVCLIVLVLVPTGFLLSVGAGLVNRSIDKWFSVPADDIYAASERMLAVLEQQREVEARGMLKLLAGGQSLSGHRPLLQLDLNEARSNLHMKALMIVDSSGRVRSSSQDADIDASDLAAKAAKALSDGREEAVIRDANYLIAARRTDASKDAEVIAGAFPYSEDMRELTSRIAAQRAVFHDLRQNKRTYQNYYELILILMTTLVLFAAVWVGLFLSKRITVPIAALSEATREISAGNLDYRVRIQAHDELGMLVRLFNDMASRLQGTTRELEMRRRYMEVILENIPTGVISLDANLEIQTLNRAARTMFSAQEATRLEQIFKGEDLGQISVLLEDAKSNAITREISFLTPGYPAHSAVTASPLSAGGFVLVVEDLTEVVRAQKASAWREVARRLAHEIKNPLTPIQLSAERIARNISRLPAASPRVSSVMQECVSAIVDEVSSLKNLVDEFVRFARLPTVSRQPNSMRELVERTLAIYEGRMEHIALSVSVPEDLPLVLMDPVEMKRVLINLIDNALEALAGEPVKELKIACGLAREGTMARLTIEDTGCGILPENRDRLFSPYFSTRQNGTGLGLAIASRIVADHGGYIGMEPNTPRGARFVIELPVCPESSLSTTSQASASR